MNTTRRIILKNFQFNFAVKFIKKEYMHEKMFYFIVVRT